MQSYSFRFEYTAPTICMQASRSKNGPSLEQPIPSITTAGRNPTVRCIMSGSKIANHVMSWYRQKTEREIQFLVSYRNRPTYGKNIPERFIPEVDESTNTFRLTIGNADNSDEGVYYCVVWFSNHYIFGEGTEIRVQDTDDIQRPNVTLFGPSQDEIHLHNSATFLCHAVNFFPEPLRIKWLLNKKYTLQGSVTFATVQNRNKSFTKTSGITIPAAQWVQGVEVTCLIEHETGMKSLTANSSSTKTSVPIVEECNTKEFRGEESVQNGNGTEEVPATVIFDDSVLFHVFKAYLVLLIASCVYGTILSLCFIRRWLHLASIKKSGRVLMPSSMHTIKPNALHLSIPSTW
ncbi:immunoglobulin alpha-2 heavy chain-like isoform X1 [Pelobates cultripes]|nr:immunoglobulin alpha-2 heavy chain-like isoform X1 [Pelobates cultripes]